MAARAVGQAVAGSARRCSRGACAPACGRSPTATGGGGARTPRRTRPWRRWSRAGGPSGAGDVNRMRSMPSTASSARSRSANCGRYWPAPRSRPYEFTFCPRTVISRTPSAASSSHLAHDVAHAPADLRSAHDGHDAEGARVVTPDLDGDPGRVPLVAPGGERRRIRLVLLQDLDYGPLEAGPLEQRRGVSARLWVPNTTSTWPARVDDQLAVLLGQAPADRDLEVGPVGLERFEPPEVAVELVVGVLADAAGVEHHDVGRLEVVGRLHALGREQPGDALGVVLVHLAPVGAHVEAARAACRPGLGHGRSV